jgi:hypothetical protein
MKRKNNIFLFSIVLFAAILFSNCATTRHYNYSLQNTLSIFLLNNGKDYYFKIPVQYIGDYQIVYFEFDNCYVLIGEYRIFFERDELNISAFVNQASDEYGNTDGVFNLVYQEEKGNILISKMDEPLAIKHESGNMRNQYNIYIERVLSDDELKNIINEYEKGNTDSNFFLWYKILFDYEEEEPWLSGIYDDFVLQAN